MWIEGVPYKYIEKFCTTWLLSKMHVQELTEVYNKELRPEGILVLFLWVIHNKMNDRNKINGCTKLRGNTEILLSPNFASLSIADQCGSFTRFHHNSAFTMVRFHHDITSCIIYRKNDLRFHTAVKVHTRVRSSRALNFPESRRREPVRTSLCFWPKRREDPIPGSHITSSRPQELIISSCIPSHCVIFLSSGLSAVVFPSLLYTSREKTYRYESGLLKTTFQL